MGEWDYAEEMRRIAKLSEWPTYNFSDSLYRVADKITDLERQLAEAKSGLVAAEDSIHTIILAFARDDWTKAETLNILRGTNRDLRQAIDAAKGEG